MFEFFLTPVSVVVIVMVLSVVLAVILANIHETHERQEMERRLDEENRKWKIEQARKKEADKAMQNMMKRSVAEKSERYLRLKDLSDRIQSYPLNEKYSYTIELLSKAQVDRASAKKYMQEVISENPDIVKTVRQAYDNEKSRILFEKEMEKLPPYTNKDFYDRLSVLYCETEREMTKSVEELIRPVVPDFHLVFHYISPAGRSSYEREAVFSVYEMIDLLKEMKTAADYQATARYQRTLVTDSLRYDVMRRDGFRCVLCGRDASDGIKLHVDHIVPVSKGGLSTMDNLRTLCEDCNRGKRDKYDEQGIN